jgi:Domain of unknown function (DUF4352)
VLGYGDEYEKPGHGQFVSFSVSPTANTPGVDYNEWDWYLRDAKGVHYEISFSGTKEPTFSAGTAHMGEKATGYITFEAPVHATLEFAPSLNLEGSVAEWAF